jgi:hypothetical protein
LAYTRAKGEVESYLPWSRKDVVVALKYMQWCSMEPPPVQILVVVANTLVRCLRAEEEKGSM